MSLTKFENKLLETIKSKETGDYYNQKVDIVLLGIYGNMDGDKVIPKEQVEDLLGYHGRVHIKKYDFKIKDFLAYSIREGMVPQKEFQEIYDFIGGDNYFAHMDEELAHLMYPQDYQGSFNKAIRLSEFFDRTYSAYFKEKSNDFILKFLPSHYRHHNASSGYDNRLLNLAAQATESHKIELMKVLLPRLTKEELKLTIPYKLSTTGDNGLPYTKDTIELYLNNGGSLLDPIDFSGKTLLSDIRDPKNRGEEGNNNRNGALTASEADYLIETYSTDKDLKDQETKEFALYISKIAGNIRTDENFYKKRRTWNKDEWCDVPVIDYICADKDYMISYGHTLGSTQKGVAALNALDSHGLSVLAYIANTQRYKYGIKGVEEAKTCFDKISTDLTGGGNALLFAGTSDGLLVQRAKARKKLLNGLDTAHKSISKRLDEIDTRTLPKEPSPFDPRNSKALERWPSLGRILFGYTEKEQNKFFDFYGKTYALYNVDYLKHGKLFNANSGKEHPWTTMVVDRIVQAWAMKGSISFISELKNRTSNLEQEKALSKMKEIIPHGFPFTERGSDTTMFVSELANLITVSQGVNCADLSQDILQTLLPSIMENVITCSNTKNGKTETLNVISVMDFLSALDMEAPWMGTKFTCEEAVKSFLDGVDKGRHVVMEHTKGIGEIDDKILEDNVDLLPETSDYRAFLEEVKLKQKLLKLEKETKKEIENLDGDRNKDKASASFSVNASLPTKKAKTRKIGM